MKGRDVGREGDMEGGIRQDGLEGWYGRAS